MADRLERAHFLLGLLRELAAHGPRYRKLQAEAQTELDAMEADEEIDGEVDRHEEGEEADETGKKPAARRV